MDEDDDDYLVDHSIFFYLMGTVNLIQGPDGKYVEHYGRHDTTGDVVDKVIKHVKETTNK